MIELYLLPRIGNFIPDAQFYRRIQILIHPSFEFVYNCTTFRFVGLGGGV